MPCLCPCPSAPPPLRLSLTPSFKRNTTAELTSSPRAQVGSFLGGYLGPQREAYDAEDVYRLLARNLGQISDGQLRIKISCGTLDSDHLPVGGHMLLLCCACTVCCRSAIARLPTPLPAELSRCTASLHVPPCDQSVLCCAVRGAVLCRHAGSSTKRCSPMASTT
jgi:hypothetical protein